MYGKSYLLVFILWFISTVCYSQSYTYSYTDPCTGNLKTFVGNTNGITLTLYGQTRFFTPTDFSSGNVELWLNSVVNSFGGNNPCATLVGTSTAINIAQNTTFQFLTIVNNLSAVSELSGSIDLLSSSINSTTNSDSKKNKKDKKTSSNSTSSTESKNSEVSSSNTNSSSFNRNSSTTNSTASNSNTTSSSNMNPNSNATVSNPASNSVKNTNNNSTTTNNSTTPSVGNHTDAKGNSNNTQIENTANSNNSSDKNNSPEEVKKSNNINSSEKLNSSNNQSKENENTTNSQSTSGGSVNVVGNSVNSLQSVSSSRSKNGNRPTILASSDLVGFNFKNTDVNYGGRFSGSFTSTRWDGLRSHGIIGDFTTAIKGPNIAGFYAFLHKKRIDLISTSITIGFENKMSIYGTFAAGQMWKFKKPKNLKLVYLVTTSYGKVYDQKFIGTAFIAGGMYDWKVSKRLDVKLLGLYVYAPYVKYYNDVLLKSPNVVLPIIGTNIGITKRFKLNINMGGAYAINVNTLNYTIMMGTRLLL
jgi:hypothetical protein